MKNRMWVWLVLALVVCVAFAFDPLPGDWMLVNLMYISQKGYTKMVTPENSAGSEKVSIHIEYDSVAREYQGSVLWVGGIPCAVGNNSVGEVYLEHLRYCAGSFPYATQNYHGGAIVHELRQVTPDKAESVFVSYPCQVRVQQEREYGSGDVFDLFYGSDTANPHRIPRNEKWGGSWRRFGD